MGELLVHSNRSNHPLYCVVFTLLLLSCEPIMEPNVGMKSPHTEAHQTHWVTQCQSASCAAKDDCVNNSPWMLFIMDVWRSASKWIIETFREEWLSSLMGELPFYVWFEEQRLVLQMDPESCHYLTSMSSHMLQFFAFLSGFLLLRSNK